MAVVVVPEEPHCSEAYSVWKVGIQGKKCQSNWSSSRSSQAAQRLTGFTSQEELCVCKVGTENVKLFLPQLVMSIIIIM